MTDPSSRDDNRFRSRLDLAEPHILSQLEDMEIIARHIVEGFIIGMHRSSHRGFSAEFSDLRAYQPGDDLRHIDWRMFGRSDRYYVKQYEEETNLQAYILIDISKSMGWSSKPETLPTKLWYAKHLAACLSRILIKQGDSVGLAAFHDEISSRLAPRRGQSGWLETIRFLTPLEAQGRTSAHSALQDVAVRIRRSGLVVLISDLLVELDTTRAALRFLRHQGHEVVVFHLIDPGERDLPAVGDALLYDPETKQELNVNIADVRSAYRDAVNKSMNEWDRELRPHSIDYEVIGTDEPLNRALNLYMQKRERLF